MAFTSVTSDLTVGQVGQLGAPIEPFGQVQSYEIAAAAIPPGYGVVLDGDTVALPSAGSGEIFAGVLYTDGSLPIESAAYGTTSGVVNAPCAVHGVRVWVATSEAVTAEDPVYLQFTTGTGAVGTFRTDDDTSGSARAVIVHGCAWDHSAASGKALLRLNLPI
jgi:hypothetical protein